MTDWTPDAKTKIRSIQLKILKKKVMLNMLITRYSRKDRIFRWMHKIVAMLAGIFEFIHYLLDATGYTGVITLVATVMYNVFLYVRDYITYGQTRDLAKEQNVKYQELYDEIESELMKPFSKKQVENDFINWITRIYDNINASDPELSQTEQVLFDKYCKEHGIMINEDINEYEKIKQLMNIKVEVRDEAKRDGVRDEVKQDTNERKSECNDESNKNIPLTEPAKPHTNNRKIAMQNLDTDADLKWIAERLNN